MPKSFICSWSLKIDGDTIPSYSQSAPADVYSCRDGASGMANDLYSGYASRYLKIRRGEDIWETAFYRRKYYFALRHYQSIHLECYTVIPEDNNSVDHISQVIELIQNVFPKTGVIREDYKAHWKSSSAGVRLIGGPEVHTAFYWAQLLLRASYHLSEPVSNLRMFWGNVSYADQIYEYLRRRQDNIREIGALALSESRGPWSIMGLSNHHSFCKPEPASVAAELDQVLSADKKSSLKMQKVQQ